LHGNSLSRDRYVCEASRYFVPYPCLKLTAQIHRQCLTTPSLLLLPPPTQEPFDSPSEELTTDGEKALSNCLKAFDLDKLLGALYEFIETYVKHSPPNEREWL